MQTLSIITPQGTYLKTNDREYTSIYYTTNTNTIPHIQIIDQTTKQPIDHPLQHTLNQIHQNPNQPQQITGLKTHGYELIWTTNNCHICQNCQYWLPLGQLKETIRPYIPPIGSCHAFNITSQLRQKDNITTQLCYLTYFTNYNGLMRIAQRINTLIRNLLTKKHKEQQLEKEINQIIPTLITTSTFSCAAFTQIDQPQNSATNPT